MESFYSIPEGREFSKGVQRENFKFQIGIVTNISLPQFQKMIN